MAIRCLAHLRNGLWQRLDIEWYEAFNSAIYSVMSCCLRGWAVRVTHRCFTTQHENCHYILILALRSVLSLGPTLILYLELCQTYAEYSFNLTSHFHFNLAFTRNTYFQPN